MRTRSIRNPQLMNPLSPRSKSVLFRVSEEEYLQLKAACRANGARSVSDFVRGRVLRAMCEPSLAQIDSKVLELKAAVQQLTKSLIEGNPNGSK
jgi:hypothetical protein